jgi:hypothetical protein
MKRLPAAVAALVLLAAPAFAAGPLMEKDVDVPRDTRIPVDLVWEKCSVIDVETHNAPDAKMVEAAKAHDQKDVTWLLVRFRYSNKDYVDHRVKLRAVLLSESGSVLGDADHTAGMDRGKQDDTISFPMKIRTAAWLDAKKLRVSASFLK